MARLAGAGVPGGVLMELERRHESKVVERHRAKLEGER